MGNHRKQFFVVGKVFYLIYYLIESVLSHDRRKYVQSFEEKHQIFIIFLFFYLFVGIFLHFKFMFLVKKFAWYINEYKKAHPNWYILYSSEESYVVVDHCPRSLVEVCSSDAAAGAKHTLLLTLLENHEGRTIEMVCLFILFYIYSDNIKQRIGERGVA